MKCRTVCQGLLLGIFSIQRVKVTNLTLPSKWAIGQPVRENVCLIGLSPPVKYFTDRSKAVLLLWIFFFFSVLCLLCLYTRLFICALWSPVGKGLPSWLSFVVSNCEFVTFPLVSWVRCGTLLYRFLIFASLLTSWQCYTQHHLRSYRN